METMKFFHVGFKELWSQQPTLSRERRGLFNILLLPGKTSKALCTQGAARAATTQTHFPFTFTPGDPGSVAAEP